LHRCKIFDGVEILAAVKDQREASRCMRCSFRILFGHMVVAAAVMFVRYFSSLFCSLFWRRGGERGRWAGVGVGQGEGGGRETEFCDYLPSMTYSAKDIRRYKTLWSNYLFISGNKGKFQRVAETKIFSETRNHETE
jgi:hypothetical protein